MRPRVLFCGLLPLVACGGATKSSDSAFGAPPSSIDLPCDVSRVLATNCQECHTSPPRFGAPMPLVTRADLLKQAPSDGARRTIDVALDRIAGNPSQMPPPPRPPLAKEDADVLRAWVSAGTPASKDDCHAPPAAGGGTDGGVVASTCTPDTKLAPASPWTMPSSGPDLYVCWGADVSASTPRHVTGFVPRIDNTKIVHHVVVFEAPDAVSPTPTVCSPAGSLRWRMVMGWAPGVGAMELPPQAGFPIAPPGSATHYVVQVHYSNPQGLAGEQDVSGFDLCTSDPRPMEADVMAFGTQDISIPPNPPNGGVYERTCTINVPALFNGIHLFAAMPHMHKLGYRMETVQLRGSDPVADLGTMPNFSFDSQAWLPVDADLATFDKVRTTCAWKNTTGAQVNFGESTSDEMCYSFTVYWPKIQATTWSWAGPALKSTCQ